MAEVVVKSAVVKAAAAPMKVLRVVIVFLPE
ncbi:hypothetical protein SSE37_24374 [Sagittula stellata E-37]|uniref:Uncharacterized protein n=1 Tax=Sagittula stellata (strain ATCC 700073 / DSM 11524 / E-37) TaxID=388399 RepID=A3K0X0_SAGS3|nr:hypothetical protein SSE37_24374 [Sagittula stellata E-37]